jgi:PAS domain S-box-containing protein
VRKDGAQIWAHLNVSLSKNTDDGSPLVFAFLEEITARKLADQELVATNQQLRLALEASTSVSWEWDVRSGRTSRFGDLQNMYGIDADRFVGHVDEFRRYVHPEDRQMVEQEITDARKSRKPYASEFRIVRADGAVRWMSARGSFHYSKEGEAERMLGIATDITERKQTEERLREYEKAVEGSEEIIAVIDRDYRYLIANRKFLDIRKQLKEDVVGHLVSEVLDKKLFETVIKHKMDQCFAGEVVTYELRYPYPEIGERDLFVSYFPIEGAAGVDRVVCVLQDITERKKSLEALRTSEERFRLAAQAGKMYAYEWDVAADIVIRSDDYVSVLGYKDQVERLTRQQIINRVHPDDRATFVDNLDQMTPVNPRSQISYRILRPDGSSLWVEKSQRGFFDEQGKLLRIIGIVADITERKQGEQALQRSEANYRLFVSQSSEGIFCQALDRPIPVDLPEDEQIKRILYESYMAECNDSLAKMYGAATKDLVGKRLAETLDVNNPTNIELTREYIRGGYRVGK